MNNKKKNSGETWVSFSLYKKCENFGQNLINNIISTFFLYALLINNASSEQLYHGFNELGETVVNIIGDNGPFPQKNDWDGLAFNVSKTNSSSQCKSANQKFPLTTMGGYTGYEFSPGFLLVLYSGTLSGSRALYSNGSSQNYSYSFSFSSMGVLSPTTNTESAWCADPRKTYNLGTSAYPVAPNGQTMGSVKTGIYVSSSVSANTSVTVPSYYINRGRPVDSGQGGPLIKGTGQSYNIAGDKLKCTISAPPTIDFGVIQGLGLKENSFISQKTGDINVNCSNENGMNIINNVKVQVLGTTAGYNYILPLRNENNELAPGEIRGWINRPADQTCSGNGSLTNGLFFNDSSKWYSGGELRAGANSIPYVFNLCGSGKNQVNNLGHASATATINISWD